MKKGIILLPLILFILSSCASMGTPEKPALTTYKASYIISLSKVERPKKASSTYGQQKIGTSSDDKYAYVFEDKMVKVFWLVTGYDISFSIQNKTNQSIKIPWDEASFIDVKGISHRVIHSGIKYQDASSPQVPSIIARKTSIEDIVVPTDYIYWKESSRYSTGSWEKKPNLVSIDFHGKYSHSVYPTFESFEQAAKANVGKSIQILLPLQIENVVNDYIFTFFVENVFCSQNTETL